MMPERVVRRERLVAEHVERRVREVAAVERCDEILVDDEVAIVGRASQVINVRGRKVNPSEVEQVIRRLADVDDVVVVGLPQADGGEVVRAVVAGRAAAMSDETVRTWCRSHLAAHKVPRSIVLVPAIRYTARGKVDTGWLAGLGEH